MYSMWDNELVDDVTERFARQFLVGAVVPKQVKNGKLECKVNTVPAFADNETITLPANQPFSIQLKFRMTAVPGASVVAQLLGVWDVTGVGKSWQVGILPNRSLRFMTTLTNGANYSNVDTVPNTVALDTDYHLAVERDSNNQLTIYLNGVVVVTGPYTVGAGVTNERLGVTKDFIGNVWDMVVGRKVIFGAPFTPPGKLGKEVLVPTYTPEVAADIVAQFGFRRDDPHNEVSGKPLAMGGGTSLLWGQLRTPAASTDTFSTDIDYFGAGDFTYEFKFRLTSMPGGLMGLFGQPGRHEFQVINDGRLMANFLYGSSFVVRSSPVGTITANNTYHVVLERLNGKVTLYINGAVMFTANDSAALGGPTGNVITQFTGSTLLRYIWDIRVAKRAMYRGNVVAPVALPKMPVDYKSKIAPRTLREGSFTSSQGLLRGFAKNFLYAGTSVSIGELYPQVYWNTTQNRMIRIKAILSLGTANAILATAPSNEPRTANTPTCTNNLRIGNETFDLGMSAPPTTKANDNDTCVYYTSKLASEWSGDEQQRVLQFF